jgi:hypothetical protein
MTLYLLSQRLLRRSALENILSQSPSFGASFTTPQGLSFSAGHRDNGLPSLPFLPLRTRYTTFALQNNHSAA